MTYNTKIARIYIRVSTKEQDLSRQKAIEIKARADGYYIAGIYSEKASGARADRPELLRMIDDLQPGDVIIAEKMDRISRLPLNEAELLIKTIRDKGAKLSIPGLVDLSDITAESSGVSKIVLESIQELLLKLALQMANDDHETRKYRQGQGIQIAKDSGKFKGRKADKQLHERIIALRASGHSIARTAILSSCSISQVKRVWASYRHNEF